MCPRLLPRFAIGAALLFAAALAHADDVKLDINSGLTSRLPIRCTALTPAGDKDSRTTSVQADEVVATDLANSAVFTVARAWDPLSTVADPQGIVGGKWLVTGTSVTLTGEVRDPKNNKLILSATYKGAKVGWRHLAHQFADDVVKQFTGEPGISSTKIVFVVREGATRELWMMDADGYDPHPLTRDHSIVLSPNFSPEGSVLVFTSYRGGGPQLWAMSLTDKRPYLISGRKGINASATYSPDGRSIACTLSQDGNSEIYVLDARGGSPQRLTNARGIDTSPAWSPTGRELAFTSDRAGTPQVYLMDAEGSNARRLTYDLDYTDSPAWSPKGDRVAFVSRTGNGFDLYVCKPDGSDAQRVVGGGSNENPHWSPDARHLIFSSDRDGAKALWVTDLDGTPPRKLDTGGRKALSPAWSPRPAAGTP